VLAFSQGALLSGFAGALFAHSTSFVSPADFTYHRAVEILVFAVFGGSEHILGPVFGASFLTVVPGGASLDQRLPVHPLRAPARADDGLPAAGGDRSRAATAAPPIRQEDARVSAPSPFVTSESRSGVSPPSPGSLRRTGGEIVGVIGPNGAVKGRRSSTWSLPSSRRPPGQVEFRGERISGLPPHAITKRGITRTFQNIRLFSTMTVEENVHGTEGIAAPERASGAACFAPGGNGGRKRVSAGKRGSCSTSCGAVRNRRRERRGQSSLRPPAAARDRPGARAEPACCCSTSRWRGA